MALIENPHGEINQINTDDAVETEFNEPFLNALRNTTILLPEEPLQDINSRSDGQRVTTSGSEIYHSSMHAPNMLAQLNEQRRSGQFCDTVIKVGAQGFDAHRNILVASSSYFSQVFDGRTPTNTIQIVNIPNAEETTVLKLIDFIYTGDLYITTLTVLSLLATATFLKLIEAQEFCWNFIVQRLEPANCFKVLRLAEIIQKTDVVASCLQCIGKNVECIEQAEEFLSLTDNQVTMLISSEEWIAAQDLRLKAIIRWVNHSPNSRQHLATELCQHIQVDALSKAYVMQLFEDTPKRKNSPWLTELLLQAFSVQVNKVEEPVGHSNRLPEYSEKWNVHNLKQGAWLLKQSSAL